MISIIIITSSKYQHHHHKSLIHHHRHHHHYYSLNGHTLRQKWSAKTQYYSIARSYSLQSCSRECVLYGCTGSHWAYYTLTTLFFNSSILQLFSGRPESHEESLTQDRISASSARITASSGRSENPSRPPPPSPAPGPPWLLSRPRACRVVCTLASTSWGEVMPTRVVAMSWFLCWVSGWGGPGFRSGLKVGLHLLGRGHPTRVVAMSWFLCWVGVGGTRGSGQGSRLASTSWGEVMPMRTAMSWFP